MRRRRITDIDGFRDSAGTGKAIASGQFHAARLSRAVGAPESAHRRRVADADERDSRAGASGAGSGCAHRGLLPSWSAFAECDQLAAAARIREGAIDARRDRRVVAQHRPESAGLLTMRKLTAVLMLGSSLCWAQMQTTPECYDSPNQGDLNDCAAREYKTADNELNALYKKILRAYA